MLYHRADAVLFRSSQERRYVVALRALYYHRILDLHPCPVHGHVYQVSVELTGIIVVV
jgi:6-pyruvoyl-tetrahydropterin synthase